VCQLQNPQGKKRGGKSSLTFGFIPKDSEQAELSSKSEKVEDEGFAFGFQSETEEGQEGPKKSSKKIREDSSEEGDEHEQINLEEELNRLEAIHAATKKELEVDMASLKQKVEVHQEPDSVLVLENKIGKEREYVQNQIIEMEIKQIAESII